jgi:hypothetical protein
MSDAKPSTLDWDAFCALMHGNLQRKLDATRMQIDSDARLAAHEAEIVSVLHEVASDALH